MGKKSDSKEHKRVRAGAKKNNINPWIIYGIAGGAVLIIALCIFLFGMSNSSKTAAGLRLGDIELGRLTAEEVKEKVKSLEGAFADSEVVLTVEGKAETKTIKANDISLEIDIENTAKAAFEKGKKKSIFQRGNIDAQYVFKYDVVVLTNIVDEFTGDVGGDLREHEIIIEADHIIVKAGKPGRGISIDSAKDVILKSFKPHSRTQAELMIQDAEPKQLDADYLYDITKAEKKDAEYIYENGTIVIKEEINGRELDKDDAAKKLEGFGAGSEDITIRLIIDPAEKTKAQLEADLFSDVLGQYSSKYNASLINRSANVELAAKNINGKILLPGEVFSYNETVGPRTAERGFKTASVYEANRVVDGMGGGICQTTSTLYPAVLYADLEIVERVNHSLEVNYVPLGMDATVSWGTIDFKFKNTTPYPIKIQTSYGKGNVSVSILGKKVDKSQSIKVITERTSYTPFTVREIVDETLEPGKKISVSNGFNGSVVNTYRIYYKDGVEVKRESLGRSVYRMAERVLRVGPPENPEVETPGENEGEVNPDNPKPDDGETDIPSSPTPSETPGETPPPVDVPVDSQQPITPEEIQDEYPEGI